MPTEWRRFLSLTGALAAVGLARVGLGHADELATYEIVLKDHKFTPEEIHVVPGKPFFVIVTNASDEADEFEMLIPALERILQPGQVGRVRMRPLAPGRFPFFGESDPDEEKGVFIAE